MSTEFRYVMNTEIIFGLGTYKKLPAVIKENNGKKAFIVSDKGVEASGILDAIKAELDAGGIEYGLFDDIEQSSSVESVDRGAAIIIDKGYDIIIAVGGGSALDSGKAMGLVVGNGGRCKDYAGSNKASKPALPVIALPTTAGTSAEVTDVAVIADRSINARLGLRSPYVVPKVAIIDPKLTISLPAKVTAATGIDALSHAIESYTNTVSATPMDLASLEAVRLIGKSLPAAVANGKNIGAREDMCMACVLIGLAYRNTRLGILHAVTGPFCGHYEIAHGIANAILLPHVMRYNAPGNYKKFADVAKALGVVDSGLNERQLAMKAADAVEELLTAVNIPLNFKSMNLDESRLPAICEDAAKSGNLAINPRTAVAADLLEICKKAF